MGRTTSIDGLAVTVVRLHRLPEIKYLHYLYIMNTYLKHLTVILKHKRYVMRECFRVGLYRQWLVHDLSKLSPTEFVSSAKYFQWTWSPLDKERAENWYSLAWLNHKAKNKHHRQYRLDNHDGKIVPVVMPRKYMLELCCDMIWAGKAYNPKWRTKDEPLAYWNKTAKDLIHPYTVVHITRNLSQYAKTETLPNI